METLQELETRKKELLEGKKELSDNIIALPLNATEKQINAWRKTQLRMNVIDEQIAEVEKRIQELPVEEDSNKKTNKTFRKVVVVVATGAVLVTTAVIASAMYLADKLGVAKNKADVKNDTASICDTNTIVEQTPVELNLSGKVVNDATESLTNISLLAKNNVEVLTSEEINLITEKCSELTEALKGTNDTLVITLTNEVNEIANDIKARIDNIKAEAKEEALTIKLAHELYTRVVSCNSKYHEFGYTEDKVLEVVKTVRKNYGELDNDTIINEWENLYVEIMNTLYPANYHDEINVPYIDTYKIFEGTNVEGVEALRLFEEQMIDIMNCGPKYDADKKALVEEAANAYTHWFVNYKENKITLRGKEQTLTPHDKVDGIVQHTILMQTNGTLADGLIHSKSILKLYENIWWMPDYILKATSNEEYRDGCEIFWSNYSSGHQMSYPIKARKDSEDDINSAREAYKKYEEKQKSLVLENK